MKSASLSNKFVAYAELFVLSSSCVALGQSRTCVVADPTGTPLNVRSTPDGRVIGTLSNGTEVSIGEQVSDARGRSWVKVSGHGSEVTGWVFKDFINCDGGQAVNLQKQGSVAPLVAAIAEKYPPSSRYPYSLIQIDTTQYLARGGKILRTRKDGRGFGGMCGRYAGLRVVASDRQMRERSEEEGSIWEFSQGEWREMVHTTAGDWSCDSVQRLPDSVRKCLGVERCF